MFRNRFRIRVFSLFTALVFTLSTFGAYAQEVITGPQAQPPFNWAALLGASPEVGVLNSNLKTIENSLQQIETIGTPLYNKIAPSNMEAMSIGERIRAILGNTKSVVSEGMTQYRGQVAEWNQAHGIGPDTTFEQELGVGLNQLGIKAGEMPLGGKGNVIVDKLKVIVTAIKERLQSLITLIRSKILAVAQKLGLAKKTDEAKKGPAKESTGVLGPEQVQYADTFSGKLSKGIAEGTQNAKASLKNSFSLTNLAVTTTVAVGTNMAIQMIHGEKPSFKKAAKMVASAEFAGGVVGSALGAAGGQFTASLVKAFLPGPIGAIAGSLIPVMLASAGGTIGGSLAGDLRHGQFSIAKAIKAIDPVDLVGSSIGSTIGMMLGAPIPIIGPIIGGIAGGFLGSKVAKWVVGLFKGQNSVSKLFNRGRNINTGYPVGGSITIGNSGNVGVMSVPGGDMYRPAADMGQAKAPTAGSPELQAAEKAYYETYMKYNKLVEQGKYDDARKVYTDLQKYSDQYNQLKGR